MTVIRPKFPLHRPVREIKKKKTCHHLSTIRFDVKVQFKRHVESFKKQALFDGVVKLLQVESPYSLHLMFLL